MKKIFNHIFWETHALLFARILMGALFVISGIQKFQGLEGTAGYIASVGLPVSMPLAVFAGIVEVALGTAIILGYRFREATLLLAAFVFIISFPFHGPDTWADAPMQQTMFLKNMAIVAGLLFMAAHGAGKTWMLNLKK